MIWPSFYKIPSFLIIRILKPFWSLLKEPLSTGNKTRWRNFGSKPIVLRNWVIWGKRKRRFKKRLGNKLGKKDQAISVPKPSMQLSKVRAVPKRLQCPESNSKGALNVSFVEHVIPECTVLRSDNESRRQNTRKIDLDWKGGKWFIRNIHLHALRMI